MVQLGFNEVSKEIMSTTMFQFLYGAIGISNISEMTSSNMVSIPLWCNWDTEKNIYLGTLDMFQFLYGAIGIVICFKDRAI